jgi:hypothetical protein
MSHESLYSKHWRLINQNLSQMSEADRLDFAKLEALPLKPLPALAPMQPQRLPLIKTPWISENLQFLKYAFASVSTLAIFVLVLIPQSENYRTKGSLRVSAYWERNKIVKPFTEDSQLQAGDKVSANIITNEDARAFWAITDTKLQLLSEVESMDLKSGEARDLTSSYELDSSNQGEQLILVVCPKTKGFFSKEQISPTFDRELITQFVNQKELDTNQCAYLGYRLRSLK